MSSIASLVYDQRSEKFSADELVENFTVNPIKGLSSFLMSVAAGALASNELGGGPLMKVIIFIIAFIFDRLYFIYFGIRYGIFQRGNLKLKD
jgi:hypothetical protein